MDKPPLKILKLLMLHDCNWTRAKIPGISASTYESEEWILQSRKISSIRREVIMYMAGSKIGMRGSKCKKDLIIINEKNNISSNKLSKLYKNDNELDSIVNIFSNDADIWTMQEKLPGEVFDAKDQELNLVINKYKFYLPLLKKELNDLHLRGEGLPKDMIYKINSLPDTRGISMQRIRGKNNLLNILRKTYPSSLPAWTGIREEPNSEIRLIHGDPITKNFIFNPDKNKSCLIDYETLTFLPRHLDYAHATAFACRYTPPESWVSIIDLSWKIFRDVFPKWNNNDWKVAVSWYFLRETINFPPETFSNKEIETRLQEFPNILFSK